MKMPSLNGFMRKLNEAMGKKKASVAYCHMNPLTPAEIRLMEQAREHSRLMNSDLVIFTPEKTEPRKNPLTLEQKQAALSESFPWAKVTPTHSIRNCLVWLEENEYKEVSFFVPEECAENIDILCESRIFDCDIVSTETYNEESRKIILESIGKPKPFVSHKIENPYEYNQMLVEGMRVNLMETYSDMKLSEEKIEIGVTYENIVTGDVVVPLSVNRGMVMCESWITGLPEFYRKEDLVYSNEIQTDIVCEIESNSERITEMLGFAAENDLMTEIFDSSPDAQLNLKYGSGDNEAFIRVVRISENDSVIINITQKKPPEQFDVQSKRMMRIDFGRVLHKDIGDDLISTIKQIDLQNGLYGSDGVLAYINDLTANNINTSDLTGFGNQFKVLSVVIKAAQDYAKKLKPMFLSVAASAKDQSRVNLYLRLVHKLSGAEPIEVEPDNFDAAHGNKVFVAKLNQ